MRKLTIQQEQNQVNGRRRVREAANRAIQAYYYSCADESTMFSLRGLRTNRGIKIN